MMLFGKLCYPAKELAKNVINFNFRGVSLSGYLPLMTIGTPLGFLIIVTVESSGYTPANLVRSPWRRPERQTGGDSESLQAARTEEPPWQESRRSRGSKATLWHDLISLRRTLSIATSFIVRHTRVTVHIRVFNFLIWRGVFSANGYVCIVRE